MGYIKILDLLILFINWVCDIELNKVSFVYLVVFGGYEDCLEILFWNGYSLDV